MTNSATTFIRQPCRFRSRLSRAWRAASLSPLFPLVAKLAPGIAILTVVAALLAPGSALADTWPSRPIRIIMPGPPGDGADTMIRAIGQLLTKAWGQPVVVENRPGAGGRIGTEAAVRAAPDGYTWIMGNAGSHGINAAVYRKLPYDIERNFAPIAQIMRAPNVLVVNPSLGVSSLAELLALARKEPGHHAYGSGGVGSSAHVSAELFKLMAGVDLIHVPYKGAGPAMTDLIGGQIAMFLGNLPPAAAHIKAGRLKALGEVVRHDVAKWRRVVAEAGIKAE